MLGCCGGGRNELVDQEGLQSVDSMSNHAGRLRRLGYSSALGGREQLSIQASLYRVRDEVKVL